MPKQNSSNLSTPSPEKPWVLAHRGLSALYPENTMLGFRKSLLGKSQAHGIELDIVFSKDGCPMVIHDDTLERTTNGKGAVESLTAEQLQRLDAGSWFSSEYATERIPKLEEVLQEFGSSALINIEIKPKIVTDVTQQTSNLEDQDYDSAELKQVLQLIGKYQLNDSVVISSFAHRVLAQIREISPAVKLSLLYNDLPPINDATNQLNRLSGYGLHLRADLITQDWLNEWSGSWRPQVAPPVLCWTVDDTKMANELFSWGVSGVFSNRSDLIIERII